MIARELLVKLGFDIDSAKLDKFSSMVDDTKNKMMSLKQGVMSNISPDISAKFNELKSYQDELASLSKSEKTEILSLNRLEKQAAKEVTKTKKAELKKQENLDKEAVQKEKNLQEVRQKNLKNSMAAIASIRQKVAIIGASIVAGFGLSIRAALKDAANFKEGKSSAGTFDKNQLAVVDSFNKSLDTTKSLIANLRNSFVVDMLPAVKETLEVFNSWVQKNKVLIQEKLKDIIVGLAGAFKILSSVIGQVLSVLDFIISKTIGWRSVIATVITVAAAAWFISLSSSVLAAARAFKVLSLALLSNPLTIVIATITTALVFLVDELTAFRSGGKTTADLLKEWGGGWAFFGDGINIVYTNISKLIDAFKELESMEILKSLGKVANPFAGITDNLLSNELFEVGVRKFGNNEFGKLGQGNVKTFALPKYNPEEVSKVFRSDVTNNARTANVTHKNSFNMNITVPAGTSTDQLTYIEMTVKNQMERFQAFQNEKTRNAIGDY